jgi:hypothetical protein
VKRDRILVCVAALFVGAAPACTGGNPAYSVAPLWPADATAEASTADANPDLGLDQQVDRLEPEPDLPVTPDLPGEAVEDLGTTEVASPDAPDGGVVDTTGDGTADQTEDLPSQDSAPSPPDTMAVVDTAAPPDAAASTRRGLVGHWRFDEGSGGVVRDEAGFANDGQLQPGTTWARPGFPARFPNPACLAFDGVDSEVRVESAGLPDIGAPKTISVWAYFPVPLPTTAVRKNLFALSRPVDGVGIQLGFDAGRASIWLRGEPGPLIVSSVLPEGTWHNLVYVFDGIQHHLYVGGKVAGSSPLAGHTGVATSLLFGSWGGTTQHFPGLIDDVRFYDNPLSASEIIDLALGL